MSYYYVARVQDEHKGLFDELLTRVKARDVLQCNECPNGNNHHHYLFVSHIKESTMRTYKQKSGIPGVQKACSLTPLKLLDRPEKEAIKQYKLYMCKGYDVEGKRPYLSIKDGKYVGIPPRCKGFYLGEVEKLHQEFWESNQKKYPDTKKTGKARSQSAAARFVKYLEENVELDKKDGVDEKYLRIRFNYIFDTVSSHALHWCRNIDKACVQKVRNDLISAGLNRFDDTGIFFKRSLCLDREHWRELGYPLS